MNRTRTILAACLLLGTLVMTASSEGWWWGPPEVKSLWRAGDIKVDGTIEDWRGKESDDASGFDFAFSNDAEDLYFFISPHTKTGKAQLSGEFGQDVVVWLDPKGGKGKIVGVKLAAPEQAEDGRPRLLALFGVAGSTSWVEPSEEDRVSMVMGSTLERGALEARIPLRYLGTPMPRRIAIGLTTGAPTKTPPPGPKVEAKAFGEGERRESGAGSGESGEWTSAGGGVRVSADEGGAGVSAGVPGVEMSAGVGGGRMGRRGGGGPHGGGGRRSGRDRGESVSSTPLELWVQVSLAHPPKSGPAFSNPRMSPK